MQRAVRPGTALKWRNNTSLVRILFACLAALCDFSAIMVSSVAAGWLYHEGLFGTATPTTDLLLQGYVISLLFLLPIALRGEYTINRYFMFNGHLRQTFLLWNIAVLTAILLAFLTKTSADVSRGASILFYGIGFTFMLSIRLVLVRIVQSQALAGGIASRRIFLIGFEDEISGFIERHKPWTQGIDIVSSAIIRDNASLKDDLALAAATARVLRPEDVFVLAPLSQRDAIDACVKSFQNVPASIHLIPERMFEGFADLQFGRIGTISSLNLVRKPLTLIERFQKRVFDIVMSSVALLLLSPLILLVAIAIKLDSRGPVFFLQRRYGFNQEPFRIYKFRSMSTMEDGRVIRQVSRNDSRVTRVGRFIRRTNIDELPQLLNVLFGDMSLVGPRPHALAHDQMYERQIANYARRHNVKPGITGWAQVNGFRGETDTCEKMRGRVEHDLQYIDHWSMLLDIRICFLTVFSSKSYKNAG
ncbi:MAG: undecaprenyl-phosphate glucose phosphotransferase [Hyphomicrobiales bacterium]|nr:undecaprenyl-phosphate glucose phosphotransferase [Hyphomicrobiales bacterium]